LKKESIFKILKNWKNPYLLRNAFLYKFISFLHRRNYGFCIFNEEWDKLIILDACRYDFFKEEYEKRKMKGKLEMRISRGSHTISFLLENFKKDYYEDIVYITANPHVDIYVKNKFFKVISVWKDGWNEKYSTVLPETMYQYSIDAQLKYPEKKLIIHFMQPHCPYIGYKLNYNNYKIFHNALLKNKNIIIKNRYRDKPFALFGMDIHAMLEKKAHIKIYKKNLRLTLPYVEKLIDTLSGKIIITADHGEAFGEFIHPLIPIRFYGHKERVRIPALLNVPWLIIEEEEKDLGKREKLEEKKKIINKVKELKNIFKLNI